MDEPFIKKFKIEENIEQELEILHKHLLRNCLCNSSEITLQKLLWKFHPSRKLWSDITFNRNRDQILMFITSIQLLCEIAIKQNSKGFVCSRIADTCNSLINNECNVIDYLLGLANDSDQFISFVASRALSLFFLVVKVHLDQRWLNRLTNILVKSMNPNKLAFALDILKRIIEWKDFDEHTLDVNTIQDEKPAINCQALFILETESLDSSQIKCLCIKSLETKWIIIVNKFNDLIISDSQLYQLSIITFLNLWEAIISVKANLSIIDTKRFYSNLNSYVSLLSYDTSPIIWKQILNLFNEVLCYGSTLALQDALAEEPCFLAHLIVRSVKDRRLLSAVPYRESSGEFGGGNGNADKVLLMKTVMLILKAVAVTVKETRSDSSSDSSLGSEIEETNADMAIIERSLKEVYRQLDNFIKSVLPFHPETKLAQWIIRIFTDQDDYLVESMLCCLDVVVGLCSRDNTLFDILHILNPSTTFLQFLQAVSFDSNVLLDFLISSETCFLLYILRILKYICRNWNEFVHTCDREIDDVMNSLIQLRSLVEHLLSKNLFPYNINPVLKLLRKCEQLYEQTVNL